MAVPPETVPRIAHFAWTGAREEAAVLVADDTLSDTEIAARVGVTRRTLTNWRQHPEFAARVGDHVGALQAAMLRFRIAKKRERVKVLDDLHTAALGVVAARRARHRAEMGDDPEAAAAAGAKRVFGRVVPAEALTGLVVEKETFTASGIRTSEWSVDTGLVREIRALHEQAAKELGQWVDRSEVSGTQVVRIVGVDAEAL